MPATDAPASSADDPPELVHVEVDELTRPRPLVAQRGLETETTEPAEPEPGQDPRHRRERHRQRLGDLSRRHPQPAERHDHREPLSSGAMATRAAPTNDRTSRNRQRGSDRPTSAHNAH
jgi:hypothetical protein